MMLSSMHVSSTSKFETTSSPIKFLGLPRTIVASKDYILLSWSQTVHLAKTS